MIITLTGKPCSGKGSVGKAFCDKYNFEFMSTGNMFREISKQFDINNILDFNNDDRIKIIDKEIDNQTIELGKTRINDNIILDSRLAWHFIPNSYKVFLDIDINTAAKRLFEAKRENEPAKSIIHAKKLLQDRWNSENKRYQELYKIDNNNLNNYNLVINTANKSIDEIVEEINNNYTKFLKNNKKSKNNK